MQEYVPWIIAGVLGALAFAAAILAHSKHRVLAELCELTSDVIKDHEHGQSLGEALMNAEKSAKGQDVVDAILTKARGLAPLVLVFALLIGASGCSTVSSEAHHELDVNAASSTGFYNDWDKLSPDDRKHAYWASGRGFYDLKHSIYGDEIPKLFLVDPFAPAQPPAVQGAPK